MTKCSACDKELPELDEYDFRNTTIRMTEGKEYPRTGRERGWKVDNLCQTCVDDLRDMLEDEGYTINEVNERW